MDFSKLLCGFVKVDTWICLSCYQTTKELHALDPLCLILAHDNGHVFVLVAPLVFVLSVVLYLFMVMSLILILLLSLVLSQVLLRSYQK